MNRTAPCRWKTAFWGATVSGVGLATSFGALASAEATDALTDAAEQAQQNENPRFRVAAYWENDGAFVLKPWHQTDRHYTNGVGASLTWPSPTVEDFLENQWNLPVDGVAVGLIFAQEMFTPDDLLADPPDPRDRPYAGYLYGGVFVQREHDDWLDHLQLNLGVVGPSSLAEPTQVWIHDTFDGDDPQGWDFQLDDEPAVQLTYRKKYRWDVLEDKLTNEWGAQVIPYGELNLGTVHRNVGGGATFRLGYRLPDDFGPGRLRDPASFTGSRDSTADARHPLGLIPDQHWSCYGFVRGAGRYVEWNTFLEGSNYQDPSPSVSAEPWVGEAEAGVAVGYRRGRNYFEAVYSATWLTRSFETQRLDDSYAALSLRWAVAF